MNDHVTDQLQIVLSVFTILVVAGNFVLLNSLLRRVREWITATHELVSLLSNLSTAKAQVEYPLPCRQCGLSGCSGARGEHCQYRRDEP